MIKLIAGKVFEILAIFAKPIAEKIAESLHMEEWIERKVNSLSKNVKSKESKQNLLKIVENKNIISQEFDPALELFGNVFDFDKNSDKERENAQTFSFSIQNVSSEQIKEVHISNVKIMFKIENCFSWEDEDDEITAVEHKESLSCRMDIAPNEEMTLQLIVTRREEEFNSPEQLDELREDYGEDRMSMKMDITVFCETEHKKHKVHMYLNRETCDEKIMRGSYAIKHMEIKGVSDDEE